MFDYNYSIDGLPFKASMFIKPSVDDTEVDYILFPIEAATGVHSSLLRRLRSVISSLRSRVHY